MQDSSNATHEEVRNAMGRARPAKPFYPSALSCRAIASSRAWTLLAHTYKAEVTTLDNVVPIRSWQ